MTATYARRTEHATPSIDNHKREAMSRITRAPMGLLVLPAVAVIWLSFRVMGRTISVSTAVESGATNHVDHSSGTGGQSDGAVRVTIARIRSGENWMDQGSKFLLGRDITVSSRIVDAALVLDVVPTNMPSGIDLSLELRRDGPSGLSAIIRGEWFTDVGAGSRPSRGPLKNLHGQVYVSSTDITSNAPLSIKFALEYEGSFSSGMAMGGIRVDR